MNMYDEFDDIVGDGYKFSQKAHDEMQKLVDDYNLGFTHNPGGGEFFLCGTTLGWRCQVSMCDEVRDLNTLRKALNLPYHEKVTP